MIHAYKRVIVRGAFRRAAAPEGGAQQWVRGCAKIFLTCAVCFAAPVLAFDLSTLRSVSLNEVLLDDVGGQPWVRFRFLSPQIARDAGLMDYSAVAPDLDWLCAELGLPYVAERALAVSHIAISVSDRPVPFGTPDPDATQFTEVYRIENDHCVWEAF